MKELFSKKLIFSIFFSASFFCANAKDYQTVYKRHENGKIHYGIAVVSYSDGDITQVFTVEKEGELHTQFDIGNATKAEASLKIKNALLRVNWAPQTRQVFAIQTPFAAAGPSLWDMQQGANSIYKPVNKQYSVAKYNVGCGRQIIDILPAETGPVIVYICICEMTEATCNMLHNQDPLSATWLGTGQCWVTDGFCAVTNPIKPLPQNPPQGPQF